MEYFAIILALITLTMAYFLIQDLSREKQELIRQLRNVLREREELIEELKLKKTRIKIENQ